MSVVPLRYVIYKLPAIISLCLPCLISFVEVCHSILKYVGGCFLPILASRSNARIKVFDYLHGAMSSGKLSMMEPLMLPSFGQSLLPIYEDST